MIVVYLITAVQSVSLFHNVQHSQLADDWVLYLPYMANSPWGPLRAVGSAFIHIGPVHLALNLIVLFLFGRELEQALGQAALVLCFLAGTIGASATIIWVTPLAPTAGASGALFAFMALYMAVARQQQRDLRGLVALILVNVGFTILWSDWVSVWGHFGGLGVGIALAIATLLVRPNRGRLVTYFVMCAISLAAVYWRIAVLSTGAPNFTVLSNQIL